MLIVLAPRLPRRISRRVAAAFGLLWACGLATLGCDSECDGYQDEEASSGVEMRFHNGGVMPIFLGMPEGCSGLRPYSVRPVGQDDLTLGTTSCGSCGDLQEQTPVCDTACATAPVIRIEPGADYTLGWDGRHYIAETMPESCYAGDALPLCTRRVVAADGTYELTGLAYDLCSTMPGSGECTCESAGAAACEIAGDGMVEGPARAVAATFEYPTYPPSTIEVELVF